jgi:hypothetical protein
MALITRPKRKPPARSKVRRWLVLGDGCVHGIRHSELTVIRSVPHRSFQRTSISMFTLSKRAGIIGGLVAAGFLVLLLAGCYAPRPQRGGRASTTITRGGHTNAVTLAQSESPKEPSRQTVESEQTLEYVLPAGSVVRLGDGSSEFGDRCGVTVARNSLAPTAPAEQAKDGQISPAAASKTKGKIERNTEDGQQTTDHGHQAVLQQPMPVKCVIKDRTDTRIGGAQKDIARELAAQAASLQPVMWAGIAMMTLVAGVLAYFGWWTKAVVAVMVGLGMIVLAATLPGHGTAILLGGLGLFALAALLVLYAYYKGQLDKNHNGIPDFLERGRDVPF